MTPEEHTVDYYELMQISRNAEIETIHRVYRMLAARYHPDNPQTGDLERFLLLNQAYETLSDPERRHDYDQHAHQRTVQPISLFETKEFELGIDGEANRRIGLLCLLYHRRRTNPEQPGASILEFETMMSMPRENLLFTVWYLKDKGHITQDDRSDYVITSSGCDYVESHLPQHNLLYKLLKAAEKGSIYSTGPAASSPGGNKETAEI